MADEKWSNTGRDIGHAFKQFGKTFVKSARTIVDKADDGINGKTSGTEENSEEPQKESNVFNDGSWRETGRAFGKAFKSLGNSISDEFKDGDKTDTEEKTDK